MFKMKYLINRMKCITLAQQVWWLDCRGVCSHPKGQGIKLYKWCVVNNDKLTKYFPMQVFGIGAYLG
jgi:hypothetical protein